MTWIFRYIAIPVNRGSHYSVTMERDHHYDDEVTGQSAMERIPGGVIQLTAAEWSKMKELLYNAPMPEGFEYEIHET